MNIIKIRKSIKRYQLAKQQTARQAQQTKEYTKAATRLKLTIITCGLLYCFSGGIDGIGLSCYAAQKYTLWTTDDKLPELKNFYINNNPTGTKEAAVKLNHPQLYIDQNSTATAASPNHLRLWKAMRDSHGYGDISHDRYDQYYRGLPVFGYQVIFHIPPTTTATPPTTPSTTHKEINPPTTISHQHSNGISISGILLTNIEDDIISITPKLSADEAVRIAHKDCHARYKNSTNLSEPHTELIIYVDQDNKDPHAKLAYSVTFSMQYQEGNSKEYTLAQPFYIIDANNAHIYQEWNNLTSAKVVTGPGGNIKEPQTPYGPFVFYYGKGGPGAPKYLDKIEAVQTAEGTCVMQYTDANSNVIEIAPINNTEPAETITFAQEAQYPTYQFDCPINSTDKDNGGWSPNNDAMFGAVLTLNMYQYYGYNYPFTKTGPTKMRIYTHIQSMNNAYALYIGPNNNPQVWLGSGKTYDFYPWTSLKILAHELSHHFTNAYSKLIYANQSGGINESFSDMAAIAAVYYLRATQASAYWYPLNWTFGEMETKPEGAHEGKPLRYFDNPTANGKQIDNAANYQDGMNVHYSSGVFNKAFYLISNYKRPDWDVSMSFKLFAKANEVYWGASTGFNDAACGVLRAANIVFSTDPDLTYRKNQITIAFRAVGVTPSCSPITRIGTKKGSSSSMTQSH
jgi:pseudolysin